MIIAIIFMLLGAFTIAVGLSMRKAIDSDLEENKPNPDYDEMGIIAIGEFFYVMLVLMGTISLGCGLLILLTNTTI